MHDGGADGWASAAPPIRRGRLDEMTRIDVTGMSASVLLWLGLLAGLLGVAGCSESTSTDKVDRPEVKAAFEKQAEGYKSKTPALKGASSTAKSRP
jgi:hypothetical protein